MKFFIKVERNKMIPERIKESLIAYVIDRRPTGDFLRNVLENDLMESFGRADKENIAAMFEIVQYIYNKLPSISYGSPQMVREWLLASCPRCGENKFFKYKTYDICENCNNEVLRPERMLDL